MAVHAGRAAPYYPSDKTFTTRLRNVEFSHDYMTLWEYTPRMKPDAKTYPEGTRMNWVTFQVSRLFFFCQDNFWSKMIKGDCL